MFELPQLPFEYNSLEPYIDEETMKVHHDGHHATYVKNLNEALTGHEDLLSMDVRELLKSLDKVPEDIRTKVKNNAGGHFHHSFFWTILGTSEKQTPGNRLLDAINRSFGSFDKFKEEFKTAALGVFGSGYAWVIATNDKLEIITTPNQDSPVSSGQVPVFTVDVWEHAYYLKYKNKRADYIDAFWNVVNWDKVDEYFNESV